jgi:hypothetical protein
MQQIGFCKRAKVARHLGFRRRIWLVRAANSESQIGLGERPPVNSNGTAHLQRLIDSRHDLRQRKFVEALAVAVQPPLAAFLLTRQT